MNLKKSIIRIALMSALLLVSTALVAQTSSSSRKQKVSRPKKERKIELNGHVLNSFTKAGVEAKLSLFTEDSVFVDSADVWAYNGDAQYSVSVPAKPAKYIFKAEHPEYHTTYQNFEISYIARNTSFNVPHILMKRKNPTEDLDVMLDQVTVVATKVKFMHKGDTLVFNADAFNVPDGSMLDELIRQLPGVEMKDGGEIYVNGKKVEELLLNGDHFVGNDNQLILENLPYFVVKDIQVYDRLTDEDKWQGKQTENKEYVMDVKMKKEFLGSYLGNVDLGAGTNNRWLARLFAMKADDHSQLAIFSNANNVNVNSQPGESTDWDPSEAAQNEWTQKSIGVNWNIKDKEKTFESFLNAEVQWTKSNQEDRTASEQFSSGGNIYGRSMNVSNSDNFRFSFSNRMEFSKLFGNDNFGLWSNLYANYDDGDTYSMAKSASLNKDPSDYGNNVPQVLDSIFRTPLSELKPMVTNRSFSKSTGKSTTFDANGDISFMAKLPWGDVLNFKMNGSYNKTTRKDFKYNKTEFIQTGEVDFRNEYSPSPSKSYNYSTSFSYRMNFLNGWSLSSQLSFSQNYSDLANEYFRLDKLGKGWDADTDANILGQLPSTRDSLQLALDRQNSEWHENLDRHYTATVSAHCSEYSDSLSEYKYIILNLRKNKEWMKFDGDVRPEYRNLSRSNFLPNLNLGYLRTKSKGNTYSYFSASYHFSVSRPDFTLLYNIVNNTNPLVTRYSNPNLKNMSVHNIYASLNNHTSHLIYNLDIRGELMQDNWGTRTAYDSEKGSYEYKPGNVNGNWSASLNSGIYVYLDSANHWSVSLSPEFRYNHNVDFDISRSLDESVLSKVDNINTGTDLGLGYSYDKLELQLHGQLNWLHSVGSRADFQTINACEFNYGFYGTYTFPFDFLVSTNIGMFSKRGYQNHDMNTDDLVWNLSLGKSLLKGKPLTLKLEAVDILHQLSNKTMGINAQGRTETWTNCIPNYIMFHAIYKFNVIPNKKKG